jgi:hypothetical protein
MSGRGNAAAVAVLIVLGACSTQEPEPRPSTPVATDGSSADPSPPTPPATPDPRLVPVETLLDEGAAPDAVLYGEMNGVEPEEIVVLSSTPPSSPELPTTPHLGAFAWDPGRAAWVEVFDAAAYENPSSGRGPVLAASDAVGQEVSVLQLIDFAGDGTFELIAGVQTYGASAGPLELWVFSWLSEAFTTEFFHRTERGGQVSFGDASITLETGVYRPGDPGCCPSAFETLLVGWDPAEGRIVVLERTEREAPQS